MTGDNYNYNITSATTSGLSWGTTGTTDASGVVTFTNPNMFTFTTDPVNVTYTYQVPQSSITHVYDRKEEQRLRGLLDDSAQQNRNRKKIIRNLESKLAKVKNSSKEVENENELLRKTVQKLLELHYGE